MSRKGHHPCTALPSKVDNPLPPLVVLLLFVVIQLLLFFVLLPSLPSHIHQHQVCTPITMLTHPLSIPGAAPYHMSLHLPPPNIVGCTHITALPPRLPILGVAPQSLHSHLDTFDLIVAGALLAIRPISKLCPSQC